MKRKISISQIFQDRIENMDEFYKYTNYLEIKNKYLKNELNSSTNRISYQPDSKSLIIKRNLKSESKIPLILDENFSVPHKSSNEMTSSMLKDIRKVNFNRFEMIYKKNN